MGPFYLHIMHIIFDYNRTLFNPETGTLYEGVLDVLTQLSKRHTLSLVTRLEPGRQDVFQTLGIADFFKHTMFVAKKTIEDFASIITTPTHTIIVGDRLADEIQIAALLDCISVWVKQGKFVDDDVHNKDIQPRHIIRDIRELLDVIKLYG